MDSTSVSQDECPLDAAELVAFLCHEVGNQLAAARLSGHVLSFDQTPEHTVKMGAAIEGLATQSGALVGLIGPLLGVSKMHREVLEPAGLLDTLASALPDASVSRIRFRLARSETLPEISANSHLLSGLLLALVLGLCEAAPESSSVRVGLQRAEGGVELFLEAEVPLEPPAEEGAPLRGVPLLHALARALLEPMGGAFAAEGDSSSSRAGLFLPAA